MSESLGIVYRAIAGFHESWDIGKMARLSMWDITMRLSDVHEPRPVPWAFAPRRATVRAP
jgi:hypothetical protein